MLTVVPDAASGDDDRPVAGEESLIDSWKSRTTSSSPIDDHRFVSTATRFVTCPPPKSIYDCPFSLPASEVRSPGQALSRRQRIGTALSLPSNPRSADDGLNRVSGPEEVLVRKLAHSGKREICASPRSVET